MLSVGCSLLLYVLLLAGEEPEKYESYGTRERTKRDI